MMQRYNDVNLLHMPGDAVLLHFYVNLLKEPVLKMRLA